MFNAPIDLNKLIEKINRSNVKFIKTEIINKGNRNRRYFWFICLSCNYNNEKINIDNMNRSWKNNKKICTNKACKYIPEV